MNREEEIKRWQASIDDDLLEEAQRPLPRGSAALRWGGLAACLCAAALALALALPGLALAATVPTAWAAWALLAEPPDGLPSEQLLEQAPGFDFATLCDFERPAAVP